MNPRPNTPHLNSTNTQTQILCGYNVGITIPRKLVLFQLGLILYVHVYTYCFVCHVCHIQQYKISVCGRYSISGTNSEDVHVIIWAPCKC